MNNIRLLIGASVILLTSAFAVYKSVKWKIKDDYSVLVYTREDRNLFPLKA